MKPLRFAFRCFLLGRRRPCGMFSSALSLLLCLLKLTCGSDPGPLRHTFLSQALHFGELLLMLEFSEETALLAHEIPPFNNWNQTYATECRQIVSHHRKWRNGPPLREHTPAPSRRSTERSQPTAACSEVMVARWHVLLHGVLCIDEGPSRVRDQSTGELRYRWTVAGVLDHYRYARACDHLYGAFRRSCGVVVDFV